MRCLIKPPQHEMEGAAVCSNDGGADVGGGRHDSEIRLNP